MSYTGQMQGSLFSWTNNLFTNKNKPVDKSSFSDVLIVDSSSVFASVIRSSSRDIYNILAFGLQWIEPSSKKGLKIPNG